MFEFNIWILISQTINFIILFLILNKFLFAPIGKVIADRKEAINKMKSDADAENEEAKRIKEEYKQRLANVQEEIEELRQRKLADTQGEVRSILANAKNRANGFMEEAEMEIFMKRQNVWNQMHGNITQLAVSAAEKIIGQSLNDDMHRKIIADTIDKLGKDLVDFQPKCGNAKQLSQQYAEDFFNQIDEKGFKPQYEDFNAFVKIYNENEELRNILESPAVDAEKKLNVVKKAFSDELKPEVMDFLSQLIKEKRMHMLNKIADDFDKLYRDKKCIKAVRIRTKVALTDSEKELLYGVITQKFGPVEIKEVIDNNVIGGLIVQFENQIVDDSLDARLKQLRTMMSKAESKLKEQSANTPSTTIF